MAIIGGGGGFGGGGAGGGWDAPSTPSTPSNEPSNQDSSSHGGGSRYWRMRRLALARAEQERRRRQQVSEQPKTMVQSAPSPQARNIQGQNQGVTQVTSNSIVPGMGIDYATGRPIQPKSKITVVSQSTGQEAPYSWRSGDLTKAERERLAGEQANGESKLAVLYFLAKEKKKNEPSPLQQRTYTSATGKSIVVSEAINLSGVPSGFTPGKPEPKSKLEQTRELISTEKTYWANRFKSAESGSKEQKLAQAQYRKYLDLERQFQGRKQLSSEGEIFYNLSVEAEKPTAQDIAGSGWKNIANLNTEIQKTKDTPQKWFENKNARLIELENMKAWGEFSNQQATLQAEGTKLKSKRLTYDEKETLRNFLAGETSRKYVGEVYTSKANLEVEAYSKSLQESIDKREISFEYASSLLKNYQGLNQKRLDLQFASLNKQSSASSQKLADKGITGLWWDVPSKTEIYGQGIANNPAYKFVVQKTFPNMNSIVESTKTNAYVLNETISAKERAGERIGLFERSNQFQTNLLASETRATQFVLTREPLKPVVIGGLALGTGVLIAGTGGLGLAPSTLGWIGGISTGVYAGSKAVQGYKAVKYGTGIPGDVINKTQRFGFFMTESLESEVVPMMVGGFLGYKLGTGLRSWYYKPRLASDKIWSGRQINEQVRSLQTGKSTVRTSEVTRTTETQNPFSRVEESQFKGVSEDAYYVLVKSGGKTMLQKIAGGQELRMLDPQLKSLVASGKYDITINYPKELKIPEQQGFGITLEERVPTGMNTMTRYGKADFIFQSAKGGGYDLTKLTYEGKLTATPSPESELQGTFFEFGKVKSSSLLNKNVDLNSYATKFYGDLSNPKIVYIKGNNYNFESLTSGKYVLELRTPQPVVTSIQKGDFLQTNTFQVQQSLLDVKYQGVQYSLAGEGVKYSAQAVKGSNLLRLFNMNKRADLFVTDASLRGGDLTGVRDVTGLGITGYKSNINLDLILPKPQVIASSIPNVNTLIDSRVIGFGITGQMASTISQSQIGFVPMLFPVNMDIINTGLKSSPTLKVSSIFGPSLKTIQLTKSGTVIDYTPITKVQTITQVIPAPVIPTPVPIPVPFPPVKPVPLVPFMPPGFGWGGESSERGKGRYGYRYSLKSRFVGNLLPIFAKGTIPLPKAKKFKAVTFKMPKTMKKTKWRF